MINRQKSKKIQTSHKIYTTVIFYICSILQFDIQRMWINKKKNYE